ncbi:hypothetical protein [Nocardia cyriacigeorgica]|uniref:hypothetical protein n=1 Tax=Nocardia cyriacigeorgica TaxID=135487 RepID=UPI0018956B0D|nr:hypothetical protein [Nocardia cyriacigeorgica]MBF6435275.1 hypothetical protein [Nocardia cyriacigeorgica]MBF6454645.1 hypothetical protein [Nocardia cyriacigeorgica]MBF6481637.1 hypothetical protein [Nocardia cyriacigeorgica]MBF6552539.1 hypothetical protein [Nocardia cyriacigeorgica]
MEFTTDVERGAWLLARAGEHGVGSVAGIGFEAYARILHPVEAVRRDAEVTDEWGGSAVVEEAMWPWAEVAARNGRVMHPLVQWRHLTDGENQAAMTFDDGWEVGQSDEGWFDPRLLAALTDHLRATTETPDQVTAAVWHGFGELNTSTGVVCIASTDGDPNTLARERARIEAELAASVSPQVRRAFDAGPFLPWPGRDYMLFDTGLTELADPDWVDAAGLGWTTDFPGVTPQLLWPADQAWVVASEIDFDSTIVAGSRTLVDAVLADDRFETFEVTEESDLSWDGDTINPAPKGSGSA